MRAGTTRRFCRRAHLVKECPKIAEVRTFRKFVAVSEKAVGQPESILPQQSFSLGSLFSGRGGGYAPWQRWAAIATVVAFLVVVGLTVANEYRRQNRTVFALNDFGRPVEVTIDDRPPVQVGSLERITLSEGRHHVKIAGAVNEEFDIDMSTAYFDRWTKSPVWVLNAGGGTALFDRTLYYAANPRPAEARCALGKNFEYFPHIDYV